MSNLLRSKGEGFKLLVNKSNETLTVTIESQVSESETLYLVPRVYAGDPPDNFVELDLFYTSGVHSSVMTHTSVTASVDIGGNPAGIRIYGGWWISHKEFTLQGQLVK